MTTGKLSRAEMAQIARLVAEEMHHTLCADDSSRLAALEAFRLALTREVYQVHVRRFEALENQLLEAISKGPLTADICKECFASLPAVSSTTVQGGV